MKRNIIFLLAILAIVGLAACTTTPPGPGTSTTDTYEYGTYEPKSTFSPTKEIKTNTFENEDDLISFLKSHESEGYYGGYGMSRNMMAMEAVDVAMDGAMMDMEKSAPTSQKASGELDFSGTNNQVESVDEADIIKTDGDYIYTITGKTLFIIKAYPGEDAEVVSEIKFEQSPSEIFVNGDKLAVFGNFYDMDYFRDIDFTPRTGMSFFQIYDISDREDPELSKDYKYEGRYFRGRMIGDNVYIVTTTYPDYSRPHPMPVIIDGPEVRSMPIDRIHYFSIPYESPMFANIHSIDMETEESDSETVVVEGSQNMYMSENNIFITYTEYINEYDLQRDIVIDMMIPRLTESDKELVEKIKETDNDVLSQREKEAKIYQIIESYAQYLDEEEQEELEEEMEEKLKEKLEEYEYMEYTIIHKISVDDSDVNIKASGKVPGHVINQFSMDEYDDVFRIATTINGRWSRYDSKRTENTNNIFTLDEDLEILDHVGEIAEGERIYSTRFMGDRLYMVTFRQIDPFFVVDLSDPNDIEMLGELKIPGFSRYLHPYDEDTIIGIGQDASTTGRTTGLKISLFDVSDVENPKEIAKFEAQGKYSSSTAEYEHRAFLFSKDKNLLVIPASSYDYQTEEGYNGAMVFDISKDDIQFRGIIDHTKGYSGNRYYRSLVERSLYIEDMLYTKSPNLLRINALDDLEAVKDVELESADSPYKTY